MATRILILIKKGKENMAILSGYSKVKDRILTSSGYKLLSRWTSSNTVDFDDGKTAQTKLGAINGIVKDLSSLSTVTDSSFAAGAVAVKEALADVNGKLNKSTFDFDNRIMVTDNIFTCQTDGYLRLYAKYGSEYIVVSLNSQPVSCIAAGNCSGNVNMYVKKGMTIKIQERSSTTNTDAFFVPLV